MAEQARVVVPGGGMAGLWAAVAASGAGADVVLLEEAPHVGGSLAISGDVVWEPFGGLCTTAVACHRLERRCYSAEVDPDFYTLAVSRLAHYDRPTRQPLTARSAPG